MEHEAPTLEPAAAVPTPGPTDAELREAHKLNHLVNEGEILASEVSEADTAEVDRMVEELFDENYSQNIYHPEVMHEKSPGQRVEDSIVDILNESQGIFRAEHASDEMDQGKEKADILLRVEGEEEPILVQLTTNTNARSVQQKLERLPSHTIFVELPETRKISSLIEEGNPLHLRGIAKSVIQKVLHTMQVQTEYQGQYHRIAQRLAGNVR